MFEPLILTVYNALLLTQGLQPTAAQQSYDGQHTKLLWRRCCSDDKGSWSRQDSRDIRRKIRLATWNALTLNGTSYMTSLVRELGKNIVSLIGITESHLTGCEVKRVEDALVLHSGDTQMINGVAVVLRGPFRESLVSWTPSL